ncbi:MAG TPA: hypothetical protein EYF95_00530 [Flavobacteriales bacterium]|nr:hypothetical protein [Flavobacteriales bacterium]HIK66436.1 hypothetical protein [Flavobacteriales bacterium]
MKNISVVRFLPLRKIAILLLVGLFSTNLSIAAERPEVDRKMQMKKAKEIKKTNVRDLSIKRQNANKGKCVEYSCKPCRLAKKGTTGTYSDKKPIACPSNDLRGGGCDFASSSECGDSDSPDVKL